KAYNVEEVTAFKNAIKDVFITISFSSHSEVNEIIESFKGALTHILTEVNRYKEEFSGYPFSKHLSNYHSTLREIYDTRSNEKLMSLVVEKQAQLKGLRDAYMVTKEFIDNNFDSYLEIKNYVFNNKHNIEKLDLDTDVQELFSYFQLDDTPGDRYPIIRKTNKKIKQAVDDRINSLKESVIALYNEVFEELEAKKTELDITDAHVISDRLTVIDRLQRLNNVNDLEISELKASDFKLDNLKILEELKSKKIAAEKGETYIDKKIQTVNISTAIAGKTLSNADEVDNLIETLRNKLMVELGKNGKIFLK